MRSSVGNIRVIDLFIDMIKLKRGCRDVSDIYNICIMVSIAYNLT